MEEEVVIELPRLPRQNFRLPFEFNDTDRLGPWDVLLSEATIKEIREILLKEDVKNMKVELPLTIELIMKKLEQISSGAWNKYGLQNEVSSHTNAEYKVPVYEVEVKLPDKPPLKILWQVDYGFSIRFYSLTQLVKVWVVTDKQERIDETLEILESVQQVYTSEHIHRCEIRRVDKLPEYFKGEEIKRFKNQWFHGMNNKRLLEIHKMLVTNKFFPISKVEYVYDNHCTNFCWMDQTS
jgi:hypothetical protein